MSEQQKISAKLFKEHLEIRNFKFLRQNLRDLQEADIAEILVRLPISHCVALFRMVPNEKRTEVFSHLTFERQEDLLGELPDNVVNAIMNGMEPDERTELLEDLPYEIQKSIIAALDPQEQKMARQLLAYPEDSIGRNMMPEFLSLKEETKVSDAINLIRWNAADFEEETLHYICVVDDDGKYKGDVSLATLVTTEARSTQIKNLLAGHYVALNVNDDQEKAVDFFRKYDFSYIAVVDDESILKGILTAEDVFDFAEEEATEDIQQFGGQASLEDSYFQASLFKLMQKRVGWLALLFLGGILTAALLRHYEHLTSSMVWLAAFVPLIISSGGNTGSQAAALVIRGLAVKEMNLYDWTNVLVREFFVDSCLGIVLALLGFGISIYWNFDPVIGFVVAISLFSVVLFGGIVGAMLPFIFKRVHLDPAVSSSPLLASLVDVVGVLIFYNAARYIIEYWAI